MQRRAKAATRKAMNMTSMGERDTRGVVVVGQGKETGEKGGEESQDGMVVLLVALLRGVVGTKKAAKWSGHQIM